MIRFVCQCGRQLQARDENVGKKARCPSCQLVMTVPDSSEPSRERSRSSSIREDPDEERSRRRARLEDEDDYDDDYDDYDDHDDDYDDRKSGKKRSSDKSSGMAVASLIFGLISLCLPVIPAIFGLIFGVSALRQIKQSRGRLGGRGMAMSGVVMSCISFIVIVPVGIMIAIMMPAVTKVRSAAVRMQDANNLKKIGLAFHNFHDAHGRLPQSIAYRTRDGKPGLSWRVAILPYLQEDNLYRQFKLDEAWDSPANRPLLARIPQVYLLPGQSNDGTGNTYYQVYVGRGTMFEASTAPFPPRAGGLQLGLRLLDVTDGTANTILVAERRSPVPWTKPDDMPFDPSGLLPPLSDHNPGGVNVLFADGSVKFLRNSNSDKTLKAAITRNGGEVVQLD